MAEVRNKPAQAGRGEHKLVRIALLRYATTQDPERTDILNVGVFADALNAVASFLADDANHFIAEVEAIEL